MDLLYFRYPQQKIQRKTGSFRLLDKDTSTATFVISDFEKNNLYGFEEHDGDGQLHFRTQAPYTVSKKEYLIGGEQLLRAMETYEMQKVVYARVRKTSFQGAKAPALFNALCDAYPNAFVYLVSSAWFGTWVGATPELLLSANGSQYFTMALAGTKPALSNQELWTDKERQEQAMVSQYIEQKITQMRVEELEVSAPYVFQAGPVEHLRTDFSFVSVQNRVLPLAQSLHPTPAVGGVPLNISMQWISQLEHNERKLYAGFLGKLDESGGQLYVNLRCCEIQENAAFLHVGGGYTKSSLPEDEWLETENKSKTLLDIIRIVNP